MLTPLTVPNASARTQILLLHAPFPGSLKFEGLPSSLLAAVAPLAHRLAERGGLDALGLLDPVEASEGYREDFRALLRSRALRALCISTSTAAIEETEWAVKTAREVAGEGLLIVVGGPHEDDSDEKCASRIRGVDLSMGGECEFVLSRLLEAFLAGTQTPEAFLRSFDSLLPFDGLLGGKVTLTSPWWGRRTRTLELPRLTPADLPTPITSERRPRFSVFKGLEVIPLMVSRGCPYGRCTFCSEPNRDGVLVHQGFEWVRELAESRPGAALYFQDSILPGGQHVERELLPLLRELRRPWGAQVYLPTLSRAFLQHLHASGCSYLYTGLESADPGILAAVGKGKLPSALEERLRWLAELGIETGISLMFGAISTKGHVLESEASIEATLELVQRVVNSGVRVAGFYPNVMTVLPGTALARGLASSGIQLDFFRMPRSELLRDFEDGSVGHNFATIPELRSPSTELFAQRIVEAGRVVQEMGECAW